MHTCIRVCFLCTLCAVRFAHDPTDQIVWAFFPFCTAYLWIDNFIALNQEWHVKFLMYPKQWVVENETLCACVPVFFFFFYFDIEHELKTIATDECSERHSQKHSLFCDSYLHLYFTSAYKKSSVLVVYGAPNYWKKNKKILHKAVCFSSFRPVWILLRLSGMEGLCCAFMQY